MQLQMTAEADEIIRDLLAEQGPTTGVRIANEEGLPMNGAGATLTVALVSNPAEHDWVMDAEGARVHIDPSAAELIADAALDARTDDQGQVEFALVETRG